MKKFYSKFLSFLLTLALVIGSLQVINLIDMASAATTSYELVTPDDNLSLGYTQGDYYKLGELKVTSTESFDTSKKVVVTVNRASAFTNQSADNSVLAYDLVISPDNTTIASGDSFNFSAASIDAKQGLEIGTVVSGDFLTAADGFYMDELTFKASLKADILVGSKYKFGTYTSTDISWRVLSVDETNNRALLVTENLVTSMAYHSGSNNCSTSDVRTWLNGTFLSGFTSDEQAKMLKVSISDGDNSNSVNIINTSGSDTVFLLSATDATSYFANNASRVCQFGGSNTVWWLRSPGAGVSCAAFVSSGGSVGVFGDRVFYARGVRPAFWLNLE